MLVSSWSVCVALFLHIDVSVVTSFVVPRCLFCVEAIDLFLRLFARFVFVLKVLPATVCQGVAPQSCEGIANQLCRRADGLVQLGPTPGSARRPNGRMWLRRNAYMFSKFLTR